MQEAAYILMIVLAALVSFMCGMMIGGSLKLAKMEDHRIEAMMDARRIYEPRIQELAGENERLRAKVERGDGG